MALQDLSYKEKHWHEACFKCVDCKVSLVDRPFACKDEKTYCPDCHDNNFALRCDACTNIFRAGITDLSHSQLMMFVGEGRVKMVDCLYRVRFMSKLQHGLQWVMPVLRA